MGEIRFVGTVDIRRYPYLVCKKTQNLAMKGLPNFARGSFRSLDEITTTCI